MAPSAWCSRRFRLKTTGQAAGGLAIPSNRCNAPDSAGSCWPRARRHNAFRHRHRRICLNLARRAELCWSVAVTAVCLRARGADVRRRGRGQACLRRCAGGREARVWLDALGREKLDRIQLRGPAAFRLFHAPAHRRCIEVASAQSAHPGAVTPTRAILTLRTYAAWDVTRPADGACQSRYSTSSYRSAASDAGSSALVCGDGCPCLR
eukprot:2191192-Rhodomonas_salina.5